MTDDDQPKPERKQTRRAPGRRAAGGGRTQSEHDQPLQPGERPPRLPWHQRPGVPPTPEHPRSAEEIAERMHDLGEADDPMVYDSFRTLASIRDAFKLRAGLSHVSLGELLAYYYVRMSQVEAGSDTWTPEDLAKWAADVRAMADEPARVEEWVRIWRRSPRPNRLGSPPSSSSPSSTSTQAARQRPRGTADRAHAAPAKTPPSRVPRTLPGLMSALDQVDGR